MSYIPSFVPNFVKKWVGNPTLFSFLKPYEKSVPGLSTLNDVLWVAPSSKWLLSIVPLIGILEGNPPVEKIDMKTSASLCLTGTIFGIYSLVVGVTVNGVTQCIVDHWMDTIKSGKWKRLMTVPVPLRGTALLASVNFVMACVNGYNVRRRWKYEKSLTAAAAV